MINSTVSGNSGSSGGFCPGGGGISTMVGGTVTLTNTIIANNTSGTLAQ